MDRHARQAKLAEVGDEGQARIAQAAVAVALHGLAADVACRYLAGAGVSAVRVRDARFAQGARAIAHEVRIDVDPGLAIDAESRLGFRDGLELRDPSARDVARGALAALRSLRAILERRT